MSFMKRHFSLNMWNIFSDWSNFSFNVSSDLLLSVWDVIVHVNIWSDL